MKHDLVVGILITVISYALLFAYCVVRNLYREHVALVEREKELQKQLDFIRDTPSWVGYASEQAWRDAINEQNRLVNLGHSIDGYFTSLQVDTLHLSLELLLFLKRLGSEPAPKYSAEEIQQMPSERARALIESQDGDYGEACEYHSRDGAWFFPRTWQNQDGSVNEMMARWNRLFPWYQKVASSYALEFKDKVETLRHRFIVEGLDDESFSLPIEGRDGVKNVRTISAKLWELAHKIKEKEASSENA